jgi:heptosyltransferase I
MDIMRIAIVKLSALGDIVHAMVVLQFIKKFNKEISIDWIVEEGYKDLLELHPDINKVHFINIKQAKKKKSLITLMREFKTINRLSPYDLVIDMQGLIKSAIIAYLIPSKVTLGFDKHSIREKSASFFYNKTFNFGYDENVIERNIALIEFALGFNITKKEIENKTPFLYSGKANSNIGLSKEKKNILLVPGASHQTKCYSFKKLAELAASIDGNFMVIWGNEDEREIANKIKKITPSVKVCDKLTLDSLIFLISRVDLVVGSDTGPTHIGWSLNIPTITLFGPTPGYRNTYPTLINKIIESDSNVNPFKIDKKDYSINQIDVKEILLVCNSLLHN